jgi:integrase
MNYTTLATTAEQFAAITGALEAGFTDRAGVQRKPNTRAAFALKLEKVTGCRIGDVVRLCLNDFVKDGRLYRLDIREEKTGKRRTFTVSEGVYRSIADYCTAHAIAPDTPIIGVTERAIQKQLKLAVDALGFSRVSTHSVRKMSACDIYEATGRDIAATSQFLQHSDTKITMRYLTRSSEALEGALLTLSM